MEVRRIFIDTEILIYLTDTSSPWRDAAIKSLKRARELEFELIINHQVLLKYLQIITHLSSTDQKVSLQKILGGIKTFLDDFTVIGGKHEVLLKLLDLMQEFPITGEDIYHANIVATMLVYKIEHLLTHKEKEFELFSEKIHIISFEEWVASINQGD